MSTITKKPITRNGLRKVEEEITVTRPSIRILTMRLTGETTLILQRFSQKAIRQIEEKQQGKNKTKTLRDPEAEFEAAKYLDADGKDSVPTIALKQMAVNASRYHDNLTKVDLKGALFVLGTFAELKFKKCVLRKDMVRLSGIGRTADVRYRPEYHNWSVEFDLKYMANTITAEQILNLYLTAGFAIGLGENRPEKSGNTFGQFTAEILSIE